MADQSRAQRFKDFLRSPEGKKAIAELIVRHRSELAVAIPRLAALWEEIERVRLGPHGRSLSEVNPIVFVESDDWVFRPVAAGLCQYTDVIDGSLDLADLVRMNTLIDLRKPAPPQDPRVAAMLALRGEGKTPESLHWKPYIIALMTKCGAASDARGFSEKQLRRLYKDLPPS